MRDEHSKEFKKKRQEFPAIRRHFLRGFKTGKFSGIILLMEASLKKG
jgi:hypothetical protein